MLLPRSLSQQAVSSRTNRCSQHLIHKHRPQLARHGIEHLPGRFCCLAAAAAAAAGADAAPEPAAQQTQGVAVAADAAATLQHLESEEQQQQASSRGIGLPPGPMEPPNEEPKKLSAAARLSEELISTSITIFGDDTELNWAVCQALSKKIGWFPVSTRKVLLGLHKAETLQELIDRDGRAAVVEAEAKMLKGMRSQLRCCIATIGDGAAADAAMYQDLYGSILIWLDEEDKRSPKASSTSRSMYQQEAEVRGKVDVRKGGFGEKVATLEDKAATVAGKLIKAMLQLLKDNKDLLARKRLYIEFGCRGDWPEVKPEDWNPVVEGLDRKAVP